MALPDLPVRTQRQLLVKRMNKFQKKYERLDDPKFILSLNSLRLNKILTNYKRDLQKILKGFFNRGISEKLVNESRKTLREQLKGFLKISDAKLTKGALFKSLHDQNNATIKAIVNNSHRLLRTKTTRFRLFTQKETFLTEENKELWKLYSRQFGRSDTIQFRDGKNFPLRTYVDAKSQDVTRQTQNDTSIIDAKRLGVLTMRVSSHGARDSCFLHEKERVFVDEAARREYIRMFPNDIHARRMKTVQQLTDDPTHIFRFNCKHRLLQDAIQFFDDDERQGVLDENNELIKSKKDLEGKKEKEIEKIRDKDLGRVA